MSQELHIHVAHSPDPDDRMMFWPLCAGLVPSRIGSRHYLFSFEEADTQALNKIASERRADVCAVSAIHALRILKSYQPLKMGASVGDAYGPVVVALNGGRGEALYHSSPNESRQSLHLLTPGDTTTAHSVAKILGLPFATCEAVPIVPLTRVFEHLQKCEEQGKPTIALLIHEGRLTYPQHNCIKLMDLGETWTRQIQASLPLGLNVISRALPEQIRRDISQLFVESCRYAVAHRDEYVKLAKIPGHSYFTALSSDQLRHYLDLYANETTVSILEKDQRGFEEFLRRATAANLLNEVEPGLVVDWI